VGAPGAFVAPEAARDLAHLLHDSLPACRVAVASDAVTSHAGALGGEAGVVLAIGTGAVAIGVGPDGAIHRADGWGPWLGDEGGGGWLGLQGLRAALRAIDGSGPPTTLEAMAVARFGKLATLAARFEREANPPRLAASFAPDVVAAAEDGDSVAAELLRQALTALSRSVQAVAARLTGLGAIRFAVVGGLSGIGAVLADPLRRIAPTLMPVPARGTALDGALLLATRSDTIHEGGVQRVAEERLVRVVATTGQG
jgi:N-acetylglucosamine kinase-like BadF-type ATPase